MNGEQQKWTGKTDGTSGMQRCLIIIFRYIDIRVIYAVMAVVIIFYMLLQHKTYIAQYRFFRQRLARKPLHALGSVYRNHYAFGQIVLDRFASYAGRRYRFIIDEPNLFQKYAGQQNGLFIVFSHAGNYEMAGYELRSPKPMHIVAFGGDTDTVMQNRYRKLAPNHIDIIPVQTDLSHIFRICIALQAGEIVSMAGDRLMDGQRTLLCPFFGEKAYLPQGAFQIAATQEKPVLTVFVMKEKWDTYRIIIHQLKVNTMLARKERIYDLAMQYVHRLEQIIHCYPYQWFCYYDFWDKETNKHTDT